MVLFFLIKRTKCVGREGPPGRSGDSASVQSPGRPARGTPPPTCTTLDKQVTTPVAASPPLRSSQAVVGMNVGYGEACLKCGLWLGKSSPSSWFRKETSLTLNGGGAHQRVAQGEACIAPSCQPTALPSQALPEVPSLIFPRIPDTFAPVTGLHVARPLHTPYQSASQGDCGQTSSDPGPHVALRHWPCCCELL